jgi:hypothetical protein
MVQSSPSTSNHLLVYAGMSAQISASFTCASGKVWVAVFKDNSGSLSAQDGWDMYLVFH